MHWFILLKYLYLNFECFWSYMYKFIYFIHYFHFFYIFFKKWDLAAKAQMKKVTKIYQNELRKQEKSKAKEVSGWKWYSNICI